MAEKAGGKLREISTNDFNLILDQHKLWIETNGNRGAIADLSGADLQDKKFININLRKANLSNSDFRGVDLDQVNLRGANLSGADFTRANLIGANLIGADLNSTNFEKADLRGATLTSADNLTAEQFFDSIYDESTKFPEDIVRELNIQSTKSEGSTLKALSHLEIQNIRLKHKEWLDSNGSRGEKAIFSNIDLANEDLSGMDFRKADFRGTNLNGANLNGSDLNEADFTNADLKSCDLIGSKLVGAKLNFANLWDADISGADLSSVQGLTGEQIISAQYNEKTTFPEDIEIALGRRRPDEKPEDKVGTKKGVEKKKKSAGKKATASAESKQKSGKGRLAPRKETAQQAPGTPDTGVDEKRAEAEGPEEAPPPLPKEPPSPGGEKAKPPSPVPPPGQPDPPVPPGHPVHKLDSDRWTAVDALGYKVYAEAIAELITNPRTGRPITIGVKAAWGAGKTSIMKMVQVLLDRKAEIETFNEFELKNPCWVICIFRFCDFLNLVLDSIVNTIAWLAWPECKSKFESIKPEQSNRGKKSNISPRITIWFNAWKYQTAEQIWAGLAHAIITQVTDRMEPVQRERFWLRLHTSRTDISKIRLNAFKLVISELVPGGLLLGGLAILLLLFGNNVLEVSGLEVAELPATITGSLILVGQLVDAWKKHLGKVSGLVKDSVQEFSYKDKAGFLHLVEHDMKEVLELATNKDRPLVIFVDDLDRCSPSKVAEVIEGINLFLSCEYPETVFVLGMEPAIVAAALNVAHKDVIEELGTFKDDDGHTPLGWQFMEKVVQLPMVVAPPTEQGLEDYLDVLLGKDEETKEAKVEKAEEKVPSEEEIEVEKRKLDKQTTFEKAKAAAEKAVKKAKMGKKAAVIEAAKRVKVEKLVESDPFMRKYIKQAADHFRDNPRQIKRFTNLFRFYIIISIYLWAELEKKGREVPEERDDDTLFKYVLLLAKWPLAVDFIRDKHYVTDCDKKKITNVFYLLETKARELSGSKLAQDDIEVEWLKCVINLIPAHEGWASKPEFRCFLAEGNTIGDKTGNGLW